MRHRKHGTKFGRLSQHRRSMLANLVCSLIQRGLILTTLTKAKVTRPLAEKMVTLAKKGKLHHRRLALARLGQKEAVRKLFTEIAPKHAERNGGYTRITKLGRRSSDAAEMAILEWVSPVSAPASPAKPEQKQKKSKKTKETAATTVKA